MPRPDLRSSYDVVVLGAGLAGHAAALSSAEGGARVLLVEGRPAHGGSTVLSGGFFAFADTPLQRSLGLDDDAGRLVRDLAEVGGGYADPALLGAYGDHQHALYEWLTGQGVTFEDVELGAGQSVPRSHRTDPVRLMQLLHDAVTASTAITFATDAKAERLIRRDGTVEGVRLAGGDGGREIAAGGVVIATGGFSRSEALLRTFAPGQSRAVRIGGAGSVGDGLKMAWHLGAGLSDMGQIKGTFGAHPDSGAETPELMLLFYLGAVIVNRSGARYVDESIPYKAIGDACLAQPEALSWQVFDDAIFRAAPKGVPLFDPRPALERGLLLSAPTLEELAAKAGIEPQAFAATIGRYNEGARAGRDPDFGRDGLSNHVGTLVPIAEPPFYAYPSTTALLATYCGLAVDAEARVIDVFGEPIDGLYAAGEVMGGFHGAAYMTGSSLGKAALFGRIAGGNAAGRAGR